MDFNSTNTLVKAGQGSLVGEKPNQIKTIALKDTTFLTGMQGWLGLGAYTRCSVGPHPWLPGSSP